MASARNVLASFTVIACGGLLFGYIIGINGNAVTKGQLVCETDGTPRASIPKAPSWSTIGYNQCYELSKLEEGLVSSLNLVGALLSSCICFLYADVMGRKLEVLLGASFYMLGSIITALAPNMWCILTGFTVYGIGIGFAMHAAPIYIAEISPANIRGTLVSAKEAVIVLGMFLGFFFGWAFSGMEPNGWRFMVAVAGIFALLMGLGMMCIPQSPRYLVLRAIRSNGLIRGEEQYIAEARAALQFFRSASSPEEVEAELQAMRSDAAASVGQQPVKMLEAFRYPRPLVIGCGLVLLQQITGQPSVLYFATNIFKSAGFKGLASASTVLVGLVKLVATLMTVWRVDKFGRRPLLFIGISMMCVALAIIATAFLNRSCEIPGVSVVDCDDDKISLPKVWAISTVIGLMLYVSGYQVGFGPISWLMISEVFPLSVRGAALSIAAIVNFLGNIAMNFSSGVLQKAFTPSGVFYGYLALSVLSILFVWGQVPETKGKTLEEIEAMLSSKRQTQSSNSFASSSANGA